MNKKSYRSKNQNIGMIIGVILVVCGGALMIYYGVLAFFDPSTIGEGNFINLPPELSPLLAVACAGVGVVIIILTAKQRPDKYDDLPWAITMIILAAIGAGVTGIASFSGLIVFGGALLYLILYYL